MVGIYYMKRKAYLKDNKPDVYMEMVLNEILDDHLYSIQDYCKDIELDMIEKQKVSEGLSPAFHNNNPVLWARKMRMIQMCAQEWILNEIVCK